MRLFIEPDDVWLFRDNKPFDAGSDHRAVSLFPPTPQAMAGAIRSHHLVVQGVDLSLPQSNGARTRYIETYIEPVVGTAAEPPPGFYLRGPTVARWEEDKLVRYYPLPLDAILVGNRYRALVPTQRVDGPQTNLQDGLRLLWQRPYQRDKIETMPEGYWVAENNLEIYLEQGELAAHFVLPGTELFTIEDRLGIGIQNQKQATSEGLIYQVGFVRAKSGVGLEVEFEGLLGMQGALPPKAWHPTGTLRIGGEARAGHYRELQAESEPWPQPNNSDQPRFKLYFTTPACFEQGWQAADWGIWFDPKPQLAAAAVARPLILGGYNLAKDRHKPAQRYVPAGSVYFFIGKPNFKSNDVTAISDRGARLGFGQFMIGRW